MTAPTVRVITARGTEHALGGDIQVLPAGLITITVEGNRSANAMLDGRSVRLSSGRTSLLTRDLTRSTGYHRLEVDGQSFWFATEDSKLQLAGIEAMLQHLQALGTGWTGQVLFSDGSGFRDPHVVYGWLDTSADEALDAVERVMSAPRTAVSSSRRLSRRGGAGTLTTPTLRLLRSNPHQYLSASPDGLLDLDGDRYDPQRVVVRRRTNTIDTAANRRAISLLSSIARLTREVLDTTPESRVTTRCRLWANRAGTLLQRPVARSLVSQPSQLIAPRQVEELTDATYRQTYQFARDLQERFGWSAQAQRSSRLSYIEQSDRIYQAYVASRLASALGLHQTSAILGREKIAFTGDRFDLYYDTEPPSTVLRSWRAASSIPDTSRPDILLHERATGQVALIDAKYRAKGGGATEDSRKDMSAYMSLYGLSSVVILYPGTGGGSRVVDGHGLRIIETPLTPVTNLEAELPLVISALEAPAY